MAKNWNKIKNDLLAEIDDLFLSKIEILQKSLYRELLKHFTEQLIIDGNKIQSVSKNYVAINNLAIVEQTFKDQKINKLILWMAEKYIKFYAINKASMSLEGLMTERIAETVRKNLLNRIGVKVVKRKAYIIAGGWLSSLANVSDPYIKVREIAINAVSQGIPFENFKKQLQEGVTAPSRQSIKHHFYTNAYDSFAQFDRETGRQFADQLGLRVARYSGGVIETSRDFCEERNGKLFTIEEMQSWATKNWKGKNSNYEPLRDLGGYNCRHTLNYVSKEKAIRERPELKDYFEQLEAQ